MGYVAGKQSNEKAAMQIMFSVIIPTYNRDLSRVFDSLNAQIDRDFEVIVVDDCSTTPVVIPPTKGLNVVYLQNVKNLGPSGSRDAGVHVARGRYIAFLDDDDEWMPEKLTIVRRHIEECDGAVDLVVHASEICLPNEGLCYISNNRPRLPLFEHLLVCNVVGGAPLVTVSREAYIAAGGFDATLRADEDYELWLRLARAGARLIYVEDILVRCYYTTRQNSVSKSIQNRIAAHAAITSRYAVDLSKLSWWHRRDRHALFYYSLAYSACLMGDKHAYVYLLRSFWYRPRLKSMGMIAVYFFGGIKALVWMRTHIKS